jgi:hypothetical protein
LSVTAVVLGAAVLLPVLFHLLPVHDGVPLGARLLPIFYAPLLALAWLGWRWALVPAAAAPTLNYLLTGRPAAELVGLLTLELCLFVALLAVATRRSRRLLVLAPVAYGGAKLLAAVILGIPWPALAASLQLALPGIGMLFVLGALACYGPRMGGTDVGRA